MAKKLEKISYGRKYVIGDNAGMLIGVTQVPDTLLCPGDDYVHTGGTAICVVVNMADVDIPPTICMTDTEAKALIKGLKLAIKDYKRRYKR